MSLEEQEEQAAAAEAAMPVAGAEKKTVKRRGEGEEEYGSGERSNKNNIKYDEHRIFSQLIIGF
jgi:hypothetical protein